MPSSTTNSPQNPYSNSTAPALQHNPEPYTINEALVSKLQIHLSCAKLKDKDFLSKSDPMVIVFVEVPKGDKRVWKEYDRTECIKNDLNPTFIKSIVIEYYFEVYQRLKFEVYDKDSSSDVLHHHDFLGSLEISLGSIVGEPGSAVTKHLFDKNKEKLQSTISFNVEELFDTKEVVKLQIKGHRLNQRDIFSSTNPFMVISRCSVEYDNFLPVYKTEMLRNSNNPCWDQFTVPVATLCNGDRDRVIRVECFDGVSKQTLIGSCDTSLNELLHNPKLKLPLTRKNSKNSKQGKHGGHLKLQLVEIEQKCSFLDFISSGLQLCFHVAIDFTASNGNINHAASLHYQQATNQYVEALWNVGRICEDYDTDKLITAYGFGAKVNKRVSHDFNLNLTEDANCEGIIGVLQAYYRAANFVEFFGPTNFSPIINKISSVAEQQDTIDKYHILLILTDGQISDMGLTKKALIRASKLPVSIIIVGVGNGNFESMVELDCDNDVLSFQNHTAQRDIVQFVAYQSFSGCFAAVDLAQEVLYEVPHQLTSYMSSKGISPDGGRLTQPLVDSENDNESIIESCDSSISGETSSCAAILTKQSPSSAFLHHTTTLSRKREEKEEEEKKSSTLTRKKKNKKKRSKVEKKTEEINEPSTSQQNVTINLPPTRRHSTGSKELSAKDHAILALKRNTRKSTSSLARINEI